IRRPPPRSTLFPYTTLFRSSAHGYRFISYRAALAVVFGVGDPDLVASAVRSSRILSKRIFAVSEMAGPGPYPCCMGVRRHHGTADRAEASRLCSSGGPNPKSQE